MLSSTKIFKIMTGRQILFRKWSTSRLTWSRWGSRSTNCRSSTSMRRSNLWEIGPICRLESWSWRLRLRGIMRLLKGWRGKCLKDIRKEVDLRIRRNFLRNMRKKISCWMARSSSWSLGKSHWGTGQGRNFKNACLSFKTGSNCY